MTGESTEDKIGMSNDSPTNPGLESPETDPPGDTKPEPGKLVHLELQEGSNTFKVSTTLTKVNKESLEDIQASLSSNVNRAERIKSWVILVERLLISLAIASLIIAYGYIFVKEIFEKSLVIEPFEVPDSLTGQLGFTGQAIAQLLSGEMTEISLEAATLTKRTDLQNSWNDAELEVSIPGVGVNLDGLLRHFRRNQIRVSGAVLFRGQDAELHFIRIYVRVAGRPGLLTDEYELKDLQMAIEQAAVYVYRNYDDFIYASYLTETNPNAAKNEIEGILDGTYIGNKPAALNGLASILYQEGLDEEALNATDRALAIDPQFLLAHNTRGIVLHHLGRNEEALKAYDRVLNIDTQFFSAHYSRGIVMLDLDRNKEALKAFELALTINAQHANSYVGRGKALRALNRNEEALKSYDRALIINPRQANAHIGSGNALLDLSRNEEALKAFDLALTINQKYSKAHIGRASALQYLQRNEEAIEAYDQALAINPDNLYVKRQRAKLLQLMPIFE